MSLHKRADRLEVLAGGKANPPQLSRTMERYSHAHQNARREIEGQEPLPDLPYTEEARQDDRKFLEETLPAFKRDPGWQTEQAQAVLNYWEQHTRENLEQKGAV